ncbi:hypothetical protein [Actinoplanes sp. NPDC051859]|uniref:hypothetical protein n=1 Tax=Actinoplanes sp. NPDC051859 TaxID=3363909 RepID=UPI00379C17DD
MDTDGFNARRFFFRNFREGLEIIEVAGPASGAPAAGPGGDLLRRTIGECNQHRQQRLEFDIAARVRRWGDYRG